MARFLTTRGATSEIENLINTAESGVVLISPFIKISASLFQNLRAADQRGVRTMIVYGKSKLETGVEEQLRELKHVEVRFLENLHAKCYYNEHSMVITSLNLYDFSEQNNREMGILITRQDDAAVFVDAEEEAKRIIGLAAPWTVATQRKSPVRVQARQQEKGTPKKSKSILGKPISDILSGVLGTDRGYCIGCRTRIDFDTHKPSCFKCYWLLKRNQRKAKYCHECGREVKATLNTPRCRSCFEKSSAL